MAAIPVINWISVKGVCVSVCFCVQVDNDSDNVYPSFQLSQGKNNLKSVESKNDDITRTLERMGELTG